MAIVTHLMNSVTILGEHVLAAPLAAGTALFALMVAFSYLIFHQTTYKEETTFLKGQKVVVTELDSVESSQERRSKKEREEEQSITSDSDSDSGDERPTKRPRLNPTVKEIVEYQLEEYNDRVHLVTFAATDAEANFILKYVPRARYLISLDAEEHHDHITEVRYARLRSFSAPADMLT
jgi:hypothetical protein